MNGGYAKMHLCSSSLDVVTFIFSTLFTNKNRFIMGGDIHRNLPKLVGIPPDVVNITERAQIEWDKARKDKNGMVSMKQIRLMVHRLNSYVGKRKLRLIYKEHDKDNNGKLDREEFMSLFRALDSVPPILETLFKQLANDQETIPMATFRDFLNQQCSRDLFKAKPQDALSLEQVASLAQASTDIDLNHFVAVLTNRVFNGAVDPKVMYSVSQDMTRPLSHYYISSSHNTYLVGKPTQRSVFPKSHWPRLVDGRARDRAGCVGWR